jgi:hypothetical protein
MPTLRQQKAAYQKARRDVKAIASVVATLEALGVPVHREVQAEFDKKRGRMREVAKLIDHTIS